MKTKIIIFLCLFILTSLSLFSQNDNETYVNGLAYIESKLNRWNDFDDVYGLKDKFGNEIISPLYYSLSIYKNFAQFNDDRNSLVSGLEFININKIFEAEEITKVEGKSASFDIGFIKITKKGKSWIQEWSLFILDNQYFYDSDNKIFKVDITLENRSQKSISKMEFWLKIVGITGTGGYSDFRREIIYKKRHVLHTNLRPGDVETFEVFLTSKCNQKGDRISIKPRILSAN